MRINFDDISLKNNIFIKPDTSSPGYYLVISRKPLSFFDRQANPKFLAMIRKISRSKGGLRMLGNIGRILGFVYVDVEPLSSLSHYRNNGPYERAREDGIKDEDLIASIDKFYPLDNVPEIYRERGIGVHILGLLLAELRKRGVKWVLTRSIEKPYLELITRKNGFMNIGRNYYSKLL